MDKTKIENHILHHYFKSMEDGISSPINVLDIKLCVHHGQKIRKANS